MFAGDQLFRSVKLAFPVCRQGIACSHSNFGNAISSVLLTRYSMNSVADPVTKLISWIRQCDSVVRVRIIRRRYSGDCF